MKARAAGWWFEVCERRAGQKADCFYMVLCLFAARVRQTVSSVYSRRSGIVVERVRRRLAIWVDRVVSLACHELVRL
jgi:hypothetical protein